MLIEPNSKQEESFEAVDVFQLELEELDDVQLATVVGASQTSLELGIDVEAIEQSVRDLFGGN